ncbi:MAG: filamentous hemagglutinin N-terminal domain-containing protein, partial [Desulfovibrio sp.]|uniref:filamentous hemagglutinin N-terminal domain-containing protein n=1 Tax=Desulfovibrio sp. TaxID=885 RepID=UPI0039E70198
MASIVFANGVTPDPNAPANKRPSIDTASNGVPLVNITAPNSSGLSHNQYHDFNVKNQGLILNNSHDATNTQLGGVIAGNPNFNGNIGAEARVILNEVTSANRSRIEGYIEVGGRAADVILANPNGITVNGGGFINAPRATLSTGVPQVDSSGALVGHDVRQGDIHIEGTGINADNTDAFTLLARTAQVEAQVRGKNVSIVSGKNRVGTDGTVTPYDEGTTPDTPAVGIDSSALGGMYANRITLIATEKGVGVNLEGAVQSTDQMVITADGKLRLREAASGGNAVLASNGTVELAGGSVTTEKDLNVSADAIHLKKGTSGTGTPEEKSSLLYAKGDMTLATKGLVNNEQSDIRSEGNLLITSADGQVANTLRNASGTVSSGKDLSIIAKSVDNVRMGSSGQERAALIYASADMVIATALQLNNELSDIRAEGNLHVLSVSNQNNNTVRNASGTISTGENLIISAKSVDNVRSLSGQERAALIHASAVMTIATAQLLNNELSEIRAEDNLNILSADALGNNSVRNASGTISSGKSITIVAKTLDNIRLSINISRDAQHTSGQHWDKNIGWGDGDERWWESHTLNVYRDYFVSATAASVIMADNNISIEADTILNSASHMAAGKELQIFARSSLRNQSYAVYENSYDHVSYCHDDEDGDLDHYAPEGNFVSRSVLTPFTASLTGEIVKITGVSIQNLADRDYASPLTGNNPAEIPQTSKPGSVAEAIQTLGSSSMFQYVASPGHHYLIETNPLLTKLGNFYGSDYFLSRIGLNMDHQQVVLLGDAYYENRLIQQQIMESTGQRFLQGYSTDADQMRGLMDAAVAQSAGLNLTAGVE